MYEYLNNGQVDDTKKTPNQIGKYVLNTKSKLMNICQIIQKEN